MVESWIDTRDSQETPHDEAAQNQAVPEGNVLNLAQFRQEAQRRANEAARGVTPVERTEQHFRAEALEVGQILEVMVLAEGVDAETYAKGMARIYNLEWNRGEDGHIHFIITEKTSVIDLWHHLTEQEQGGRIHTQNVTEQAA